MSFRCAISLLVVFTGCFIACYARPSLDTKPGAKLIGKWQEDTTDKEHTLVQFEFFTEGTVIENEKALGKWRQYAAGSYGFVDETHVKVELQPNWAIGVIVYEVIWQDQDHLSLRAADKRIQLTRVKT